MFINEQHLNLRAIREQHLDRQREAEKAPLIRQITTSQKKDSPLLKIAVRHTRYALAALVIHWLWPN
jgi:hypothetical protein